MNKLFRIFLRKGDKIFNFSKKAVLKFEIFYRDEFGLNGSIECESRLKAMNGDSTQSRIARYKEERRKQLAGQFANLSHNGNDTSSSSSSVDGSLKKTSFRPLNSNLIKGMYCLNVMTVDRFGIFESRMRVSSFYFIDSMKNIQVLHTPPLIPLFRSPINNFSQQA